MAIDDETRLKRKYGRSAIYLRQLLHKTIPETVSKNSNIISLMVDCGAARPEEVDTGTLSKWLSGHGPCNITKVQILLEKRSNLDTNEVAEHVAAIDFMQSHAGSLPDLTALPNTPMRVRRFLEALPKLTDHSGQNASSETLSPGSAVIDNITVDDGLIGNVTAAQGAEASVTAVQAPQLKIGDVTAGRGASVKVANLRASNRIHIGNVRAGVKKENT